MIDMPFLGILKKYESCRIEDAIFVKLVIKHKNECSTQTFLDSLVKKLGIDNISNLFEFPVRWRKMVIDTSDYILKHYKILFGEIEFEASLHEIIINRKLVNGSDIFDYFLVFMKPSSEDLLDRLITEAYLEYKEENNEGKRVYKEFDVKLELLDKKDKMEVDETMTIL